MELAWKQRPDERISDKGEKDAEVEEGGEKEKLLFHLINHISFLLFKILVRLESARWRLSSLFTHAPMTPPIATKTVSKTRAAITPNFDTASYPKRRIPREVRHEVEMRKPPMIEGPKG